MYIYKIEIKNFRNLRNFTWKPDKHINVLFGHNGCGKTNIAEALALLFTPNRYRVYFDKADYYLGSRNNKIIIRAWLADIDTYEEQMSLRIQHINANDEPVSDDSEESCMQVLILQLESAAEDKMEWSFVVSTGSCPCSMRDRSAIDYIYIDTSRNPVREVGLQEKSVFYQLSKAKIGNELNDISKDVVAYANKRLSDSEIIGSYLDTLKSMGRLDIIEQYNLMLKNPESSWNTSGYELGTCVGEADIAFDRQSNGIQSLFLLLLMKKKLEGAGIVFIEELEQSLEPKNQRYIAAEYRNLKAGQIFITSHSTDIISHFDYKNVFVVLETGALQLFSNQSSAFIKEVTRSNKKAFISSLMSDSILLVEGESELGAFPVYSYHNGLSFSYLDLDIIKVGGKGAFKIYAKAYKNYGKNVYVLLDNDADVTNTVNGIKNIADKVILACNDYEQMICPYISQYADELSSCVDFQSVKNKLLSVLSKPEEKCGSHERKLKLLLVGHEAEVKSLRDYEDLKQYPEWFCYILHDSFATTYYATALANIICEKGGVPQFFSDIMECIEGNTKNLELMVNEKNVWKVMRK